MPHRSEIDPCQRVCRLSIRTVVISYPILPFVPKSVRTMLNYPFSTILILYHNEIAISYQ